jgi:hypothetical protein
LVSLGIMMTRMAGCVGPLLAVGWSMGRHAILSLAS